MPVNTAHSNTRRCHCAAIACPANVCDPTRCPCGADTPVREMPTARKKPRSQEWGFAFEGKGTTLKAAEKLVDISPI
jgi:hypothetical protein